MILNGCLWLKCDVLIFFAQILKHNSMGINLEVVVNN